MTRRLTAAIGLLGWVGALGCAEAPEGPNVSRPSVIALQASLSTSCALLSDGTLWCWGPGIGGVTAAPDFGPVQQPFTTAVSGFALGDMSLCAFTASQATYCWGLWFPIDGAVSYGDQPTVLTDTLSLRSLASGMGHTCGVLTNAEVACWGSSLLGKRGLGFPDPTLGSTIPNKVIGAVGYAAVAVGRNHTCGLVQSGGLVTCWGEGVRLGDSSSVMQFSDTACFYQDVSCALSPQLVSSLTGIHALAAGPEGTCALGAAVWCWGTFDAHLPRPTLVTLPAPGTQVTVGNMFGCALTATGNASCWGRPGPWLGRSDSDPDPAPVQTQLRFRLLAAGNEHTCGVATDDHVYCWGAPTFGPLGPGLDTSVTVPIRIRGPW